MRARPRPITRCIGRIKTIAVLLGSLSVATGYAADIVTPPALYAPTLWQGKTVAIIRVLRRVDSHVEVLTIPVGQDGQYKTLHIHVAQCVERPPTLPGDSAIHVILHDDTDRAMDFDGWILQNEPSLSTYTNPLYGISVLRCAGDYAPPAPGPLPSPKKPDPSVVNASKAPTDPERDAAPSPPPHVLTPPLSQSTSGDEPHARDPSVSRPVITPNVQAPRPDDDAPLQLAPP